MGSLTSEIESLTGNPLWEKLMERMEAILDRVYVDLENPGEFEHGKAIGKREVATAVIEFTKILMNESGSNKTR